jgi:hypothetical protein
MFKQTGKSGRRSAGSGGVPKAKRVSATQMGKVTTQQPPHIAFQDPPGSGTHGFDSNSPRIDEP